MTAHDSQSLIRHLVGSSLHVSRRHETGVAMSQEVTNEEETVSLVEVAKGATELLAGKGFTLQSDYVTTKFSKCKPNECPWKKKEVLQRLDSGYNWPFRGWLADEVWVLILFEYDGCDVNNAR